MPNETEAIKRALRKKKKAPVKDKNSDYLSSGSTLLNLACSGRINGAFRKGHYYYVVGDSQSGKAQPLDAAVLTPDGWKKMGEINIGDTVVDPDGGTGIVAGIFPQGRKPVFRVVFSDGGMTECCEDHLWHTFTQNDIRRGRHRVERLQDIREELKRDVTGNQRYIPTTQPIEFSNSDKLPLDPYLLGLLLGNGHFEENTVLVSTTEKSLVEKIRRRIPGCSLKHKQGGDWQIINRKGSKNLVLEGVRKLGLSGTKADTKFIPASYMKASVSERILLLQGLMDTNGWIQNNAAVFTTTSLRMANGLEELVRSLGGLCSRTIKPAPKHAGEKRDGLPSHNLRIQLPLGIEPFTLKGKALAFKSKSKNRKGPRRRIEAIVPIGEKHCQCISVTTQRGLYVTDDYIVTHNTFLTLTCLAEASINPAFDEYRFIFDDVENGALMDFEKFFGRRMAERLEPPSRDSQGRPVYSRTIEDVYFHLDDAYKEGRPFIYILDSMDAVSSVQERKKFQERKKALRAGDKAAGEMTDGKAKANSAGLRNQMAQLRDLGSIFIAVGQTRDKMNAMPFEDKKTRAGGRAPTFYATLELWSSIAKRIKRKVRDKPRVIGVKTKVHVRKNRIEGKDRTVILPIYYSTGFDDIGGCIDYLIEEGHWRGTELTVTAPEYEFKGSKEKLIRKIEEEGLEQDLRLMVAEIWEEIEEKCRVQRKFRYE